MDKDLKSLSYAFVSQDLEIYNPDGENDCIVVSKPVCSKCGQFWHTSLSECYLCGELNYYLYRCTACGRKYSITNSAIKCTCGLPNSKLVKACVNDDCLSNTDTVIQDLTIKEGGVFNLNSSFSTTLNYCISCGNTTNQYKYYRIYVYNTGLSEYRNFNDYVLSKTDTLTEEDLFIIKQKQGDQIEYAMVYYEDWSKNFTPDFRFNKVSDLVDELFQVQTV